MTEGKVTPEKKPTPVSVLSSTKNESKRIDSVNMSVSVSNPKLPDELNRKIVRLVGEKPVVAICLNDVKCKCLWDTGSMVSIMSADYFNDYFADCKLYSVEEFLGGGSLSLSAANNTELPIDGVLLLDFGVDFGVFSFKIPFLVTKEKLSNPILGYNAIEHLVGKSGINSEKLLQKLLPQLSGDSAKIMATVIEKGSEMSENLGTVKLSEDWKIPANCLSKIKGKTRVHVGSEDIEIMFAPEFEFSEGDDLLIYESAGVLKKGKSVHCLNLVLYNPTPVDVVLKKNTVLGTVLNVAKIIPLPANPERKTDFEGQVNKLEGKISGKSETEDSWWEKIDLSHLDQNQQKLIEKTLKDCEEVFSKNKNDIGFIPDFKMPINLTDNVPVSEPYRKIPRMLYDEVKSHINNLLANGWIRQSSSPYSSPMVCVRKRDSSLRLCIDFRKLNMKTIPDKQPIPRVQDLLDGLGGQKWFSTLDMSQAYHQGQIDENSRKYTAFSTPWSLYEWCRIPYGLTNAPPVFQRYINDCLYHLRDKICLAYLDDILIYGKTFEEHVKNVGTVLRILIKKGIKLNPKKCQFVKKELRYLGRLISHEGYRPDPENSIALEACKNPPKTVGQLRSLLGFLGYYRNFVKDFSRRMKPVYDLLKSEGNGKKKGALDSRKKILWLPLHQEIVDDLVGYLRSPEVIAYPDFDVPFIVHCDASESGLGSVLYQRQNGKLRVISFASRTLSPAEKNYHLHSSKLEFLALKWAVTEKFADYLYHGPSFDVYTDNNPLTYVLTTAKLNASGLRWVARLADFNFSIHYRAGKKHIDADYLSRHPCNIETVIEKSTDMIDQNDIRMVLDNAFNNDRIPLPVSVNSLESPLRNQVMKIKIEDLIDKQMNDPVIGPVYTVVKSGERVVSRDLKHWEKGSKLLFRQRKKLKIENGILYRNTSFVKQIVLPEEYRPLVYRELHEKLGHLGCEKVTELARKRFYWPYMKKDIEFYIRKRCRCIISKKPSKPEKAKLIPLDVTSPFDLVSIDFLKLDVCRGGFKYVLVVVDHFTRYVQLFATKSKGGRAAADQIYNNYVLHYGFPRRLHHDQGREFDNDLFRRLNELAGVTSSRTTSYHPQGDGQPERLNRTLINMLKCLGDREKSTWKDHLSKLAFAYNATVNKSTGFSPFYLMFGREARLPIDVAFGIEFVGVRNANTKTYDKFVKEWRESMEQAVDIARKNIRKSNDRNESYYNRKANGVNIVVGDAVLLRNRNKEREGATGKLKPFWENVVYEVVDIDPIVPVYSVKPKTGRGKLKRIHRNNIMCCNDLEPENDPRIRTEKRKSKVRNLNDRRREQNPTSEYDSSENDVIIVTRELSEVTNPEPEDVSDGDSDIDVRPEMVDDPDVVDRSETEEIPDNLDSPGIVDRSETEEIPEIIDSEESDSVEEVENEDDISEESESIVVESESDYLSMSREGSDDTIPYQDVESDLDVNREDSETDGGNDESTSTDESDVTTRPRRKIRAPKKLTYDEIGKPSYK